MSDERISIEALESTERAVAPGEWKHGSWQYESTPKFQYTHIAPGNDEDASITVEGPPPNTLMDVKSVIGGCGCCGSPSGDHADIQGIVALRNAAPALIAIAKAALAWRDGMSDDDYKVQDAVCNALVAALKAVRP